MANEIRRRYNFLSGRITDNPLTNTATTINSTELAGLPAIASTEYAVLVLDPTGVGNGPEVVYVTAHTGSATSATIVRGREGTSGVQHASTIYWVHVATNADFGTVGASGEELTGNGLPFEGQEFVDTTTDRVEMYSGSAWQRLGHYSASGRTGGSWSRATNLSIPNGTETTITFTTEGFDSDSFLAPTSGSVTIPSGLGGIYAFDIAYTWATVPTGTAGANGVRVGSTTRIAYTGLGYYTGSVRTGYSGVLTLSAADIVTFYVVQNSGGSINITEAALNFTRIAI